MIIREATPQDNNFLQLSLYWASTGVNIDFPASQDPHYEASIQQYTNYQNELENGRGATLIAEEDGNPIGAAWYRFFSPAQPGYGFLDADTPEVTIAVKDGYRGRGVGRALLSSLISVAAESDINALSLNVEENNAPAFSLYQALGFVPVRTEVDRSITMRLDLSGNQSTT